MSDLVDWLGGSMSGASERYWWGVVGFAVFGVLYLWVRRRDAR